MAVVFTSGRMAQGTMVNGMRIELKAKVSISGKTEELILDNGKTIICMVKVHIPGPMEEDTKVNMKWIRNMATVFIIGLMDVYTKVIGLMENNTVKENTFYKLAKLKSVNGLMEKEQNGYMKMKMDKLRVKVSNQQILLPSNLNTHKISTDIFIHEK